MTLELSERYQRGSDALRDALLRTREEALAPPPNLTLSEWAEQFAYLSPETSAKGGKFHAFAYQNGIMDAVTDPTVTTITVMKSARVGYTKILDHAAGYFIHQDPSPVLIVMPRVEDAEDYSRREIAPMLRDTPVLADIAGDIKAKDSGQRILSRIFRNGASLSFVGANSPGGFRRITARIICFDEVDGYPVEGAGDEGDQITLGIKRSETFWNRKIILGSTPTIEGMSRIEKSFNESDKRYYFVPCPQCGHKQRIKWPNIKWENDDPDTAYLLCDSGNGCVIEEHHKVWMIENGEWVATEPMKNGHAGFCIWAGYSLFPNASWRNLVSEFLRVKNDPLLLKTFVNLVLGETWKEGERADGHSLMGRREDWGTYAPQGVLLVTCGVDVQGNRVEIERVGWGADEESWSLDYHVIHGDPSAPQLWQDLDEYIQRPVTTIDGRVLTPAATCIDSGGNHTQAVYRFCATRARRRVWAIKGMPGEGRKVWPKKATRVNRGQTALFVVGVDSGKEAVYARLKIKTPGGGYCHFPMDRDQDYFDQLTSETIVTQWHKGFPKRVWQKRSSQRNEALDVRVYAYAGLQSLNVRWDRELGRAEKADRVPVAPEERRPAPTPEPIVVQETPAAPAAATEQRPKRRFAFSRRVVRSPFMG